MKNTTSPKTSLHNTHPDKEYFHHLISNETNPDKIAQLKEEEEAHNHPNRHRDGT